MSFLRATLGGILLVFGWVGVANAATVTGTVTGPDGPVANAKIIANSCAGAPIENSADGNGNFSIEFDDGTLDCLEAGAPQSNSGLIGERLEWVDVSYDRELHLFLAHEVILSGTVEIPEDFDGNLQVQILRLDKRGGGDWPHLQQNSFSSRVAAGVYAIMVFPECFQSEAIDQHLCPLGDYFSYVAVDATEDSIENLVVPLQDSPNPVRTLTPPKAALINVSEPDEGGLAIVSGAPGAVPGPSQITIVNLNTGHLTQGGSLADGSFSIPFRAPPGSSLQIRQDPTGITNTTARAPGAILRVPLPQGDSDTIASFGEACLWWCSHIEELTSEVANLGTQDNGQIWLTGNLGDRQWSPGETVHLNGTLQVFTRNAADFDPAGLSGEGNITLERIFDEDGRQQFANPVFMSHTLTPTGMPIEFRGDNDFRGGTNGLNVGDIAVTGFTRTSDQSFAAEWEADITVPNDLPDGIYSLESLALVDNLNSERLHFEGAFGRVFDTPFETNHVTPVKVGSPAKPRLSWALGVNDISNASRGTIAVEDRKHFNIAGRQTANSDVFILPKTDLETGQSIPYRLEPFAPLIGAGNRGWLSTPTVPFKYPSGSLNVRVTRPDGSKANLGSAPFAQGFAQQSSVGLFSGDDPGNRPVQYFGLTTLDPKFWFTFKQYGLHQIEMTGTIEDVLGNEYDGGGTYEVWVARKLDMEFGVVPGTPFEVGDAFSPTVIVQPGVAAEIEITITHYPMSKPSQKIEQVIKGKSNRFGYFHDDSGSTFVFENPGEYRVDVTSSYLDDHGVLWMGSETWASVVETPDSPLVAHGMRAFECGEGESRQQWIIDSEVDICGTHLPFPYHTGDIVWSLDTDIDPFFTAIFPGVSVQDTQGDFEDMLRPRSEARFAYHHHGNFEAMAAIGELRLFSSTPTSKPAGFEPNAADTHRGYFYSTVARPGVRIRDMVSEGENQESYWRFDGSYYDQSGVGANGDETMDFKFQFGGAVYRAPDRDFYYYGAYGSLWVGLPDDDPTGTRVMPPFQGNGGGPTGGPIMTLDGEEIDLFFHPGGIRPGSILEVGDVASFAGNVAPTLPTEVLIEVTSPGGVKTQISGMSNKIGYFHDPDTDFVVDAPGIWTVKVTSTFRGRTSAGQVSQPYPTGGVLGTDSGEFEFYVVSRDSESLEVGLPEMSWVEPGKGPFDIQTQPTDELSDARLHYTTVMPGFQLEAGDMSSLTYTYDAPTLNQTFPNLDIHGADNRYGVDTITMSFLVSGEDGAGNPVFRARQVLLQGEELLAPSQPAAEVEPFSINAGHSGAWFNPDTAGQGQLIDIEPASEFMFLAWFAYTEDSSGNPNQQHWLTAQGNYSGDSASLPVYETLGGKFDDPQAVSSSAIGTLELSFNDCASGQASYTIDSWGTTGSFPLSRVIPGTENVCLAVTGSDTSGLVENDGWDGAWYDPETAGQGFLIDVHPNPDGDDFIFIAWFTYGDTNASGQRWLTAQGPLNGAQADIAVYETTGGSFDDPTTVSSEQIGTMSIQFNNCNSASLTYELTNESLSGSIDIVRVIPGTESLCEELAGMN